MPSHPSSVSTSKRKKRVGVACDFCRQRKLGCDNAKPKCENCKCQGRSCTYSERVKKIRPTNVQIRHLEEENARLKLSLSRLRSRLDTAEQLQDHFDIAGNELDCVNPEESGSQLSVVTKTSSSELISAPDVNTITTSSTSISTRNQPWLSTGDREIQFHGPSSAMFDGQHQQNASASSSNSLTDPLKRFELLGACIKQRQMEPIDLAAGRLDFDGVDPELGMHLLSVFWNRQHASGSVVYRPAFMRDMACNGPYFSKILLNAIYFAASKNSTRSELRCTGASAGNIGLPTIVSPFRQRAEELLSSLSTSSKVPIRMKSDITTIQALLVMSDALFSWCDERSLSWLYSGLAINMIVDLGIHTGRQTPAMKKDLTTEDLEIRRRLFWAAFVQDKIQSIYQGRPARLREADVNVPILFLDDYEELEQFNSLSYSRTEIQPSFPTRSVSVFEQLCKLSIIMDRLISGIYAENCKKRTSDEILSTARSLHGDLERWRNALPEHPDISLSRSSAGSLTPHALCLMSMYYSLIILLHRPFVSDGHIHANSASVNRAWFATCAAAASGIDGILRVYAQRFCNTTVPYFMSYATYVSGTIHVRIAAQRVRGSDAHKSLRNCLNILSQQQGVCRAPWRARQILLGLARRLNVDISDKTVEPPIAREDTQSEIETRNGALPIPAINAEADGAIPATSDFDIDTEKNNYDMLMSGLDIDAIIESFDFDQTGKMHTVNSGQLNAPPILDDGAPYPTSHDLLAYQETNNLDQWLFQDSLFGYDSLFQMINTLEQ